MQVLKGKCTEEFWAQYMKMKKKIGGYELKTHTITETIRLHKLRWFGRVERMEEKWNSQKSIVYEFGINKTNRQTKK
jgi:hypothetical protein